MQDRQHAQHHDRETRLRFMRIDETTATALREFWPAAQRALPEILEGFYAHVMREPKLAKLIGEQSSRLKGAQARHWEQLFSGRFDEPYIQSVRTIGLVHNKIGLEPRWYIGGYAFVAAHLIELAVRSYRWRTARLAQVLRAVNTAIALDMDFAISVYQEAMLEERAKRQQSVDRLIAGFDTTVSAALGTLSTASSELKSTAESMSGAAGEASRQSSAVAAAAEEASTNVQTVASATEEMASSVKEIGRQVETSTRISSQAVSEADRANLQVKSLADAAQKIGDVVRLINDIAGQTNLLALNATIEAARAGDAGKGFAVVASEVKSLANQTAKATEDIAAQITAIQAATGDTVASIEGIGKTITELNQIASTIAAAVEEQGATTQEIARNVNQTAAGTTGVSRNIADVTRAVNETGAASGQVLAAAEELGKQGDLLKAEVGRFFENIRAA